MVTNYFQSEGPQREALQNRHCVCISAVPVQIIIGGRYTMDLFIFFYKKQINSFLSFPSCVQHLVKSRCGNAAGKHGSCRRGEEGGMKKGKMKRWSEG